MILEPFIKDSITSIAQIEKLQDELFKQYPFYDNFLFNKETKTIRTAVYLKKDIVNTPTRKDFVINTLKNKISDSNLQQILMFVFRGCHTFVH